jgi:arylsulfatase A-like enzyme
LGSPGPRASIPTFVALLERRETAAILYRTVFSLVGACETLCSIALHPACLGVLYLLTVTVTTAGDGHPEELARALGGSAGYIESALAPYRSEVARTVLRLTLFAAALGGSAGAVSGCIVSCITRGRTGRLLESGATLLLLAAAHAAALGYSIASYPALYEETLYRRAGAASRLQVFVTDRLGPMASLALPIAAGCIGLLALWLFARRRPLPGAGRRPPWALAASALALFVVARWYAEPHAVPGRDARGVGTPRPNVLVLAADSLREDHVTPELTPHLLRLAARGTRFSEHYTSLARTFPSWVTLLTGLYPHHHSIRSSFPDPQDFLQTFDSIPRRLQQAGYATAVISDYGGDLFGSANLGFAHVDAPRLDVHEFVESSVLGHAYALLPFTQSRIGRALFPAMREIRSAASADLLADEAIARLRSFGVSPFFAVVFFSTPHDPYAAPYPYYSRFTDPQYRGQCKYSRCLANVGTETSTSDVAQVRALYRGAVQSVDDAVDRILRDLDARGLASNTIVIVTSDHGEALYDGATFSHGNDLYGDVQNHVPLIVADPRRVPAQPRLVETLSGDVDLAATIYEMAGAASEGTDGVSLVARMQGAGSGDPFVFAETGLWLTAGLGIDPKMRIAYPTLLDLAELDPNGVIVIKPEFRDRTTFAKYRMVFDGRMKLVYAPTPNGPVHLLFDTLADPKNVRDIGAEEPEVRDRLKTTLWAWMLQDAGVEERRGFLAPKGRTIAEVDGPPPEHVR